MILDLFEYSEQTDDEVGAVHDETDHNKTDQRKLAVAECTTNLSYVGRIQRRSGQLTVPSGAAGRRTWNGGGKVVVKAERQGCRPGADETYFQQGMGKLPGSTP